MFNTFAAHVTALLLTTTNRRNERGQTTAEYVGIMVVIVAIIGAIAALNPDIKADVKGVVHQVFTTLQGGIKLGQ